ncbi:RDD family protein [Burkholderiaceae bacterium DAT-1]|nr:RDD family protein [Burkholderiaceae bacterium DAT-1]
MTQLTVAPRWRRLIALAYEAFLVLAVMLAIAFSYALILSSMQGNVLEFLLVYGGVFAYFAYCWRKRGQTLAMKVWRLQLLDSQQHPVTLKAAAIRYLILTACMAPTLYGWMAKKQSANNKWIWWLTLAIAALPFLWAFVDRSKQFLHDRLAGTTIWLMPIPPRE